MTANGQPDLNATVINTESGVRLENAQPTTDYVLKHASGKEQPVKTEALPAAIVAAGSWSLALRRDRPRRRRWIYRNWRRSPCRRIPA